MTKAERQLIQMAIAFYKASERWNTLYKSKDYRATANYSGRFRAACKKVLAERDRTSGTP